MFASVGADGSVRMFDLRHLEHSTIIYEDPQHHPLLRLCWNKQDPNYLATMAMDGMEVSPTGPVRWLRSAQCIYKRSSRVVAVLYSVEIPVLFGNTWRRFWLSDVKEEAQSVPGIKCITSGKLLITLQCRQTVSSSLSLLRMSKGPRLRNPANKNQVQLLPASLIKQSFCSSSQLGTYCVSEASQKLTAIALLLC